MYLVIFGQEMLRSSAYTILARAQTLACTVPEKEAAFRLACLVVRGGSKALPDLERLAVHVMSLAVDFLYIPYWVITPYDAHTSTCPDVSGLFSGAALDSVPTVGQRWVFEHEAFNVLPSRYQCLPPALVLLGELTAHSPEVQTKLGKHSEALRAIALFLHLSDEAYRDLRIASLFLVATLIVNGFRYGSGSMLTEALVRHGVSAGLVSVIENVIDTPAPMRMFGLAIINHVIGIFPPQGIAVLEIPRFVDTVLRMLHSSKPDEQKAATMTVVRVCTSGLKHVETRTYVQAVMKDSGISDALLRIMGNDDASMSLRGFAASALEVSLCRNSDEQKACAHAVFSSLTSMLASAPNVDFVTDGVGRRITGLFCTMCSSNVANVHHAVSVLNAKVISLCSKPDGPANAVRLICMKTLQAIHDSSTIAGSIIASALRDDASVLGELFRPLHPTAALLFDAETKSTATVLLMGVLKPGGDGDPAQGTSTTFL